MPLIATHLYWSNAFSMTPNEIRVCSWTLLVRSETCSSCRNASMRSCMRAHCSGKGSGVSVTRGSAKPNAVFIAGRSCARGGTSYSTSLRLRRAIRRLLGGLERFQGIMHVSVLDEAELKGHAAYRYRPLGSSVPNVATGQAPMSLATQASDGQQPATAPAPAMQRPGSPLQRDRTRTVVSAVIEIRRQLCSGAVDPLLT
jgi:hypothetical protein